MVPIICRIVELLLNLTSESRFRDTASPAKSVELYAILRTIARNTTTATRGPFNIANRDGGGGGRALVGNYSTSKVRTLAGLQSAVYLHRWYLYNVRQQACIPASIRTRF